MLYTTLLDDLQDSAAPHPRYDTTSIAFHWTTAMLVAAMFGSAYAHEAAQDGAAAARMLLVHRSLGIAIWCVTVARLVWKRTFATTPPLPTTMMPAQRTAAHAMQFVLYAFLLLMPITGLLQSALRGKPFPLIFGEFPAVVARNRAAVDFFHRVHGAGATVLLALIGLHALAGLYHGVVRRDGVFGSMLPDAGSKTRRENDSAGRE